MHDIPTDPSADAPALNARWRAFQLMLADQLKALSPPTDIVETATRLLAGYLGASHCWYTEVGEDGSTFVSRAGWFGAGIPPMPTYGRIGDFGPAVVATLGSGSDFVVADVAADARTAAFAGSYRAIMIGALLAVPIFKNGRWAANLNVAKPAPYGWTGDDILVTRDVGQRCGPALFRAAPRGPGRQALPRGLPGTGRRGDPRPARARARGPQGRVGRTRLRAAGRRPGLARRAGQSGAGGRPGGVLR